MKEQSHTPKGNGGGEEGHSRHTKSTYTEKNDKEMRLMGEMSPIFICNFAARIVKINERP